MAKKPNYEFDNLTKQQEACLTLVESLGIYELRAVARVFGDISPTVVKRDDLINYIMKKIISGEELKPLPTRQGRPYKLLSNIEGILAEISQITGKDYSLKSTHVSGSERGQKAVTFKQAEKDIYKKKMFPIEIAGSVCENVDHDLYVLNQENGKTIFAPKDIILKPNDYITGTAVVMNSDHEYVLDEVKTINFQKAKSYIDKSNPYEASALPTEYMTFGKTKIKLGSRYLVKRFLDNIEETKNLTKKLNENGIITMALLPNVMKDDVVDLCGIGFNATYIMQYDDSPFKVEETLEAFIRTVTRLQDQGLKIAVFVDNIYTLADAVDYAFKTNTKAYMGHTEISVELIKKLVLLARAGGKNKHTTLFTSFDEADLFDQVYVSCVYKVSKKLEA